jgi:hypothetical protein
MIDGDIAKADFTFGTPTKLGPSVNSSANDWDASISADRLLLFFGSTRSGGIGNIDIWASTRATIDDPWGEPTNLGPVVNSPQDEADPSLSTDQLSLYFRSNRPGGIGREDLWVTTRSTTSDPWGEPVNLGSPPNSIHDDSDPSISADGLSLYFSEYGSTINVRPDGYGISDIWVTTRPAEDAPWGEPVNLGPTVNSTGDDFMQCISSDGLMLFFSSARGGGSGGNDLYMSRRATTSEPWTAPVNLGPTINGPTSDSDPEVSADGSVLYFNSRRPGGGTSDIYQAPIIPVVDFDADGFVDSTDICIMADHWGEDYTLCDIGPMPWGDGVVDVQDLVVLAEHLFTYPGAVAYWKLDETEGDIAHDSIGDNDGTINGDPAWQPEGGMVNGALLLDGVDDYVLTEYVRDPSEGPLSMFTWIKGGAPGQVVLSQKDSVSWLCTDASEGNLMTELKGFGRSAAALLSQTVITDGNWHRIGLVWDGSQRTLYVDGVAVAEDIQDGMEGSDSGLYIGSGKALESGTFWSGLIDDVRIYNRTVRP